jgi:transcription-repair coupling factor (superfamily II helicase)
MLQDGAAGPSDQGSGAVAAASAPSHAALGPSVARLCAAAAEGDVLAIVCGEQRGEAVAKAAAALTGALVLWYPPPDALPGEAAASSPAVAGQRFAALAALRDHGRRHVLLVTDAAGAAHRIAPPPAYAGEPLTIARGDAVAGDTLAQRLDAMGYFADDRVDEAGEYAIRGGAIDIHPADAAEPIRIHISDGRVEEIGRYDPVSQLGRGEPLDRVDIVPPRSRSWGMDR